MNTSKKKIVIIGATSAIAEHCARLWAAEAPAEMILVGRDRSKTELVASDLRVRAPASQITSVEADFINASKILALAEEINKTGPIDILLIAHGSLPDQARCQNNLNECREALDINGVSPVLFAEAFVNHMEKADRGTIAIIGSVAGDRGRKSNYVYGAAKGLVTRYAQGLQHRLAKTDVKVVLVKPGPTDTPMTAYLKTQGIRLAPVQAVAESIVNGIERGKPVVYVPAKWGLIMHIIRHIPKSIFDRLDI